MDISVIQMKGRGQIWAGYFLCFLILLVGVSGCGSAGSEKVVRFEVEEGMAVETLRVAARQAEVEFIFSSELVKGVRTPFLTGKHTPSDAFRLMLADSPFVVVRHQHSGVYSIQKASSK